MMVHTRQLGSPVRPCPAFCLAGAPSVRFMSPSATGPGKAAPLRILIADDHPVVREGLVTILSLQDDLEVVGQACDGEEACRLYDQLRPDILILDLALCSKPEIRMIGATLPFDRMIPADGFYEWRKTARPKLPSRSL